MSAERAHSGSVGLWAGVANGTAKVKRDLKTKVRYVIHCLFPVFKTLFCSAMDYTVVGTKQTIEMKDIKKIGNGENGSLGT